MYIVDVCDGCLYKMCVSTKKWRTWRQNDTQSAFLWLQNKNHLKFVLFVSNENLCIVLFCCCCVFGLNMSCGIAWKWNFNEYIWILNLFDNNTKLCLNDVCHHSECVDRSHFGPLDVKIFDVDSPEIFICQYCVKINGKRFAVELFATANRVF